MDGHFEQAQLAQLVDAGSLRALVAETFDLANTASADRGCNRPGKTVLIVP